MERDNDTATGPGRLRMIDVGQKPVTERVAIASGVISLQRDTIDKIQGGAIEKGDVLVASKLAGIAAAKKTSDLLPLCHPLPVTKVNVDIFVDVENAKVVVSSEVSATARTGVEMEALVATAAALLNIWDMVKMHEKDERGQYPSTFIGSIRVDEKHKG